MGQVSKLNKTYGNLTVLKEDYGRNKHKQILVLVKCLCGIIKIVDKHALTKGATKTCGSAGCKIANRGYFRNDLTGLKFGKLTVIKFIITKQKNYRNGYGKWLCKCECGNTTLLITNLLTSGNTKSCSVGCGQSLPFGQTIVNEAYRSHLGHAKERNYISNLSREQYQHVAEQPCVYCGSFSYRKDKKGRLMPFNSVDRKNNEPYYDLKNSQSTCFDCQEMKMARTHEEFLSQVNKIAFFKA